MGKASLVDWVKFTWSLGRPVYTLGLRRPPRISSARAAITSFTFMCVDVPAPAWYGVHQELVREAAAGDLPARLRDRVGDLGIECADGGVGARRGHLHPRDGPDDLRPRRAPGDRSFCRAHGLRAVVGGREVDLTQRVSFDPDPSSCRTSFFSLRRAYAGSEDEGGGLTVGPSGVPCAHGTAPPALDAAQRRLVDHAAARCS